MDLKDAVTELDKRVEKTGDNGKDKESNNVGNLPMKSMIPETCTDKVEQWHG